MSTRAAVSILNPPKADPERRHRLRLRLGYLGAVCLIIALTVYGFDYYLLSLAHRPFSPKHVLLKPSGPVGLLLGTFGTLLFLLIFLYALRKRWPWLRRQGSPRHWLDFHVLMGLTAPFVIAFHASFKFRGIAGMAFWIMSAVAVSGVIGRYLYGQIPRSLTAAELSLQELHAAQKQLTDQLAAQNLIPPSVLVPLFRLPEEQKVRTEFIGWALCRMIVLDLKRLFQVARLRRQALRFGDTVTTLGGFFETEHPELERVVELAGRQAALSKRILFLSRSQQVFHLWHVVHRPFSYSFAVLAVIHITVVVLFGVR